MDKHPINTRALEALEYILKEKTGGIKKVLADGLGINYNSLTEVLGGRQRATPDILARIVETYDIDGNWLLTGRGSMLKGQDYPEAEVSEPATEYGKKNPSVYDIADLDKRLRLLEIEVKSLGLTSDKHAMKIAEVDNKTESVESKVETVLREFIKEHS